MYPAKTLLAVAAFLGLALVPRAVPALRQFRGWDARALAEVWDFQISRLTEVPEPPLAPAPAGKLELALPPNLEDPRRELDRFYAALLLSGERPVRVLHYGDSPTTGDLVTGDIRALLQREFGDAGAGFILIARPWAWYNHRGVEMSASDWKIDVAAMGEIRDGLFGLGGATFRGEAGAAAQWRLKDGRHRRAEVAYLAQPGGGSFSFEADGEEVGAAETAAEETAPGFASFDLPEGSTRFTVRATSGRVRLYGVEFLTGAGGVVYSSLGVNGAGVSMLSHAFSGPHWTAQLRHYQPDLVVLGYGTNESGFPRFVETAWGAELKAAIRRLRGAVPDASVLLMSPMDRGERNEEGDIVTVPAMPRLVEIESQVARDTGVAFFNTFRAMGGPGTMGRWYSAQPRLVGADFIHPLPRGGKIVGELLFRALQDGFSEYKLRQLQKRREGAETSSAETQR